MRPLSTAMAWRAPRSNRALMNSLSMAITQILSLDRPQHLSRPEDGLMRWPMRALSIRIALRRKRLQAAIACGNPAIQSRASAMSGCDS